ncbi:MAG: helix-turn-helix transcriptional regulator [Cytophagia bacterium]|nr:helix-turn-helix transcriptional regulator [Cytophagia bacterium]
MNAKTYSRKLRNDYLSKVVNQLIDIRLSKGVTLEELNYRLGVSDYLVAKWESGHKSPSTFMLYCWAKALSAEIVIVANDNQPFLN